MSERATDEIRGWYEQYGHAIYRRCMRLLRNEEEARDAVQEIFAQALRHHASYRREAPPLHWLHRIATHHCLKRLRKQARQPEQAAPLTIERIVASGDIARQAAQRQLVLRLLEELDERTQIIAVAVYVEGLLQDEVAEVTGISTRAIRKRLSQFQQKAQKLIAKWGLEQTDVGGSDAN